METADGTVTLRDAVATLAGREEAEQTAWSSPGLIAVNNRSNAQALDPTASEFGA